MILCAACLGGANYAGAAVASSLMPNHILLYLNLHYEYIMQKIPEIQKCHQVKNHPKIDSDNFLILPVLIKYQSDNPDS